MIEITRPLARTCRAVFRRAVPPGYGRGPRPSLALHAGKDGLRLRSHHPEVAVEFHLAGDRPAEVLTLPAEALSDFEGRQDGVVSLEAPGPGTVVARWDDGGVPQSGEYVAPDPGKLPPFPEEPRKLFPVDPGLLQALDEAARTAAREGVRYAVQRLQLRGGAGEVVATDGKQLLIQGGFALPWKEDVLVPATAVFACRELPQDVPAALGRTDKHVCVRVGPWAFFLAIDPDARFPDTRSVIPAAKGSATVCRLAPEDAAFLAKALPRLPGREEENAPLTLDLDGHFTVRARAGGQGRTTEVVLSRSEVVGPPVRFLSNRQYLARAVALGFTEFRVTRPDVPVVCTDGLRTFLWMPLGKDGALPPGDDVLRITSAGDGPAAQQLHKRERREPMTRQPPATGQATGQGNGPAPPAESNDAPAASGTGTGLGALIAEAEALREALHDACGRTGRLLAALKRHRKQSRLVQTTLASLRQLQQIEG